jgi:hypothetical protein
MSLFLQPVIRFWEERLHKSNGLFSLMIMIVAYLLLVVSYLDCAWLLIPHIVSFYPKDDNQRKNDEDYDHYQQSSQTLEIRHSGHYVQDSSCTQFLNYRMCVASEETRLQWPIPDSNHVGICWMIFDMTIRVVMGCPEILTVWSPCVEAMVAPFDEKEKRFSIKHRTRNCVFDTSNYDCNDFSTTPPWKDSDAQW